MITRSRAGVIGSSECATCCGFSVFSYTQKRHLHFVRPWLDQGIYHLASSEDKMQAPLQSIQNASVRLIEVPISRACGPRPEKGHYERPNSASHSNLNMSIYCMRNAATFRMAKPATSSTLCTGFLILKFRVPAAALLVEHKRLHRGLHPIIRYTLPHVLKSDF